MSDREVEVFTSTIENDALPVHIALGSISHGGFPRDMFHLTLKEAQDVADLLQELTVVATKPSPKDETYRGRNYRLCTAIDLTKLSMCSDELIEAGAPKRVVDYVCSTINAQLAILRGFNPKDPE